MWRCNCCYHCHCSVAFVLTYFFLLLFFDVVVVVVVAFAVVVVVVLAVVGVLLLLLFAGWCYCFLKVAGGYIFVFV